MDNRVKYLYVSEGKTAVVVPDNVLFEGGAGETYSFHFKKEFREDRGLEWFYKLLQPSKQASQGENLESGNQPRRRMEKVYLYGIEKSEIYLMLDHSYYEVVEKLNNPKWDEIDVKKKRKSISKMNWITIL